ncbi:hypothetical protein D3C72_1589300 [compost metagenome]
MVGAVGAEQDRASLLAEVENPLDAFLLKALVTHGQRLVDDQYIRLHGGHQCECEAHIHPGGIGLHRPVYRIVQLGEGDDLRLQLAHLLLIDANQAAGKVQVLTPSKIAVEPRTQLQNGGDPPGALNGAGRGLHRAGKQLQQRALACAIVANHANALATLQSKAHIAQSPVAAMGGPPRQQCLHPLARRIVELVFLAQVLDHQHRLGCCLVCCHSQSTS